MQRIKLGKKWVGETDPVYFIADISANHDGDLERAKALVHLAAQSGAHAAKFQNFRAEQIVSQYGFEHMSSQLSHQAKWKKSVIQVYREASLPWEWTEPLKKECDKAGIEYFSTPYDLEAVDMLDPYVEVFKVGSGDITWTEMLLKIASKKKPVLLAAGASELDEVKKSVDTILKHNRELILMQCNTNYTGSPENFKYINLNALKAFRQAYPEMVLGLSDHTPGHATVLGAVTLGARAIEKHFTDDTNREGPDHPFSMTPQTWREMVDRTQELMSALGDGVKRVEDNERDTVVVQRRSIRADRDLKKGEILKREDLIVLRPCPQDGLPPYRLGEVVGKKIKRDVEAGDHLRWNDLE